MKQASGLPRHLRSPGDEGYRTPTIEDAQRDLSLSDPNASLFFQPAGRKLRDVHTSALEALHNPAFREGSGRGPVVNDSQVEFEIQIDDPGRGTGSRRRDSESRFVKLSWKKRIRHFTWAYFTLTMATGGIANVLSASRFEVL